MKVFFTLGLCLICITAFADRVCLEKSTGKLIEYQSGNAPLGTLTKNAINYGYDVNNLEEKYVTPEELEQIIDEWIGKPARDKDKIKKDKIKDFKDKLKIELGFTQSEVDLLFE